MKKFLFIGLFMSILSISYSQYTGRLSVNARQELTPGSNYTIAVTITNTSSSSYAIGKSVFALVTDYEGSTNAGEVFNETYKLPETLPAGKSYTFRNVKFTSPVLPGRYPVNFSFRWGNRVICEEDITFVIKENYEAEITMRANSYEDSKDVDLIFTVQNTGHTAWPEGSYGLKFEFRRAPSGASSADKDRFSRSNNNLERWDFEPGEKDELVWRRFRTPTTEGQYTVRVTLLLGGRPFDAEGAYRDLTFNIR